METKKAFDADLENDKSSMFLMGLLVALCATFILMEWSQKNAKTFTINDVMPVPEIEVDYVPITIQTPPPPVLEQPAPVEPFVFKKNTEANTKPINVPGEQDPTAIPDASILTTPVEIPVEVDPDANIVYDFKKVDKKAEYPGGMNGLRSYLSKNLVFPKAALETGTQGTVIVQFIVEKDGTVTDVEVIRSIDPALDKEAMRVVKMMKGWTPAQKGTKKVRQKFTLPIAFVLGN